MWKSEIRSRPSDKSCGYSTCPTVIFTRLRQSDEWNFEPWDISPKYEFQNYFSGVPLWRGEFSLKHSQRYPIARPLG